MFITEQMFYKNKEIEETEVGSSELLQCKNCNVTVHKFCYESNENFVKFETGIFFIF